MFNASATYVFAIILFILQATLLCIKFFIGTDNCCDAVLARIAARLKIICYIECSDGHLSYYVIKPVPTDVESCAD